MVSSVNCYLVMFDLSVDQIPQGSRVLQVNGTLGCICIDAVAANQSPVSELHCLRTVVASTHRVPRRHRGAALCHTIFFANS